MIRAFLLLLIYFCFNLIQINAQAINTPFQHEAYMEPNCFPTGKTEQILPLDSAQSVIEIRTYTLKPGMRTEFHQTVAKEVAPLLKQFDTGLFVFGPSLHDKHSYYLIRVYDSLEMREQDQRRFYESSEWLNGPREKILSMIENFMTVVVDPENIDFALSDSSM